MFRTSQKEHSKEKINNFLDIECKTVLIEILLNNCSKIHFM